MTRGRGPERTRGLTHVHTLNGVPKHRVSRRGKRERAGPNASDGGGRTKEKNTIREKPRGGYACMGSSLDEIQDQRWAATATTASPLPTPQAFVSTAKSHHQANKPKVRIVWQVYYHMLFQSPPPRQIRSTYALSFPTCAANKSTCRRPSNREASTFYTGKGRPPFFSL